MSRVTRILKNRLFIVALIIVLAIGATAAGLAINDRFSGRVRTVTNSNNKITQISYDGEEGVDALSLLKKHTEVKTEHYSFGDFVTSIDGVKNNSEYFWMFYVNDKESSVGASTYVTKDGDRITWKYVQI